MHAECSRQTGKQRHTWLLCSAACSWSPCATLTCSLGCVNSCKPQDCHQASVSQGIFGREALIVNFMSAPSVLHSQYLGGAQSATVLTLWDPNEHISCLHECRSDGLHKSFPTEVRPRTHDPSLEQGMP